MIYGPVPKQLMGAWMRESHGRQLFVQFSTHSCYYTISEFPDIAKGQQSECDGERKTSVQNATDYIGSELSKDTIRASANNMV